MVPVVIVRMVRVVRVVWVKWANWANWVHFMRNFMNTWSREEEEHEFSTNRLYECKPVKPGFFYLADPGFLLFPSKFSNFL